MMKRRGMDDRGSEDKRGPTTIREDRDDNREPPPPHSTEAAPIHCCEQLLQGEMGSNRRGGGLLVS